jgi:hypothetical protein
MVKGNPEKEPGSSIQDADLSRPKPFLHEVWKMRNNEEI